MTLRGPNGSRKYLNGQERRRFLKSLDDISDDERLFCLMLMWSGSRLSETLALTPAAIDLDSEAAAFKTLKQRKRHQLREVPLPKSLIVELDQTFSLRRAQTDSTLAERRLWPWSRTTAWRTVKAVMRAAQVNGSQASPKGLRHTFGVAAFQAKVPSHLVQRWLGHASLRTTAIYADVSGPEERAFAERLWNGW